MMGTGEGEEEAFLLQQAEGQKIEIFISPRGAWKMTLLFCKGRGVKDDDIIPGLEAPHDLEGISSDQLTWNFPKWFKSKCSSAIAKASSEESMRVTSFAPPNPA